MVNVGLRAFVWNLKSTDEQIAREVSVHNTDISVVIIPAMNTLCKAGLELEWGDLPCIPAVCEVKIVSIACFQTLLVVA